MQLILGILAFNPLPWMVYCYTLVSQSKRWRNPPLGYFGPSWLTDLSVMYKQPFPHKWDFITGKIGPFLLRFWSVLSVRNWCHLFAELCKLFFLMLGSKRIPCTLKGSGQVLLSPTESSAVQAAPHGWRPGQVIVSWIPVLHMSHPGCACCGLRF